MKSTSETGHAKNLANFQQLITFCTELGADYNPSRQELKLTEIKNMYTNASNSVTQYNQNYPVYTNAVSERELLFQLLNKLTTRIINALRASAAPAPLIENANTLVKKIQGRSSSKKSATASQQDVASEPVPGAEIAVEPPAKKNSVYQMSYDSRLQNFDKLIKLLASITQYAPNEPDLKINALESYYGQLFSKNNAVVSAYTVLNKIQLTRNIVLYDKSTGLVSIALLVKVYIKSLYGATSPQYKHISKLRFTYPKN